MKRYICLIGTMLMLGTMFLTGCSSEEENLYSYYEDMEPITVEDNKITLVLYENQAIPYRWKYMATDDDIVLIEDQTVDKGDFSLQAGVSETLRVFVFECGEVNEAILCLSLESINSEPADVSKMHRYRVTYVDGQLTCEEVIMK